MGNHKLRKETVKKLKAAGYGRLYSTGCPGKHRPNARECKRIGYFLNTFHPGALVHDRFENKVVKTSEIFYMTLRLYGRCSQFLRKNHWVMSTIGREATYTDGTGSCECSCVCESPGLSNDMLKAYLLQCSTSEYAKDWFGPTVGQKMLEAVRSGAEVYDENGKFLPEWKDIHK